MGSPYYRRHKRSAQQFDAFYRDEWGPVNTWFNTSVDAQDRVGFRKNRFTVVSTSGATVKEAEGGWTVNDARNCVPGAHKDEEFTVRMALSSEVLANAQARAAGGGKWVGEVSVTLLFAVRHEMNRHGLRSFVERAQGQHVVMHMWCNEDATPRYPRSIDHAQIDSMLANALGGRVPWKLRVIAGYSYGSAGVNQVILNELVDLATVRRLVFFDCLYLLQEGSTAEAIRRLKRKAGGDLRIVVYKTSAGGNTVDQHGRLKVVLDNPGLIDRRGLIENLYQSRDFQSLCVFRSIQAAVDDGVVTLPRDLQWRHDQMVLAAATLPRGCVISSKSTWEYVRGPVPEGVKVFGDWAQTRANKKTLTDYAGVGGAKLGDAYTKDTFRYVLWRHYLPGWWEGAAEDIHDLVIPEVGWEYLTY